MKKYILNICNMVLVKKVHNNPKRHLFYLNIDGPKVDYNINLGEEYYDFWCSDKKWNGPDGDNKFSERDVMWADGSIKSETNSWLRMHWWLVRYYHQNIGRWKRIYKIRQRRRKLFLKLNKDRTLTVLNKEDFE